MHICGGIIRDIPLFADAPTEFTQSLAWKLKFEVFPLGELIFRKGHYGDRMYFIVSGQVSLLLPVYRANETRSSKGFDAFRTIKSSTLQTDGMFPDAVPSGRTANSAAKYLATDVDASGPSASDTGGVRSGRPALLTVPNSGDSRPTGKEVLGPAVNDEPQDDREFFWNSPQLIDQSFMVVGRGSFFGEGALFTGVRAATAQALTACTLLSLDKADFRNIFATFPDLLAKITELSQTRRANTEKLAAALASPPHEESPTAFEERPLVDKIKEPGDAVAAHDRSQSADVGSRPSDLQPAQTLPLDYVRTRSAIASDSSALKRFAAAAQAAAAQASVAAAFGGIRRISDITDLTGRSQRPVSHSAQRASMITPASPLRVVPLGEVTADRSSRRPSVEPSPVLLYRARLSK